jgi:hypothetical protein
MIEVGLMAGGSSQALGLPCSFQSVLSASAADKRFTVKGARNLLERALILCSKRIQLHQPVVSALCSNRPL